MRCAGVGRDGDRFGASIAFLGDLDRDGHPDIAVGAPKADANHLTMKDAGEVYLLELLPSECAPGYAVGGVISCELAISWLAGGDVKRFQILSATYSPTTPQYNSFVYFSAPLTSYDYFGSAVGGIDVDGDGLYDLVIGARGFDAPNAPDVGAVFVSFLDWRELCWSCATASNSQFSCLNASVRADGNLWSWADVTSQAGLRLPLQAGENMGATIAFINDRFTSLLIGAPGEPLGSQGGSVYVLRAQPF
jgi:hypothetical protein